MDMLNWLGLAGQRAVIVHHDDLGSLWAMNAAYQRLPFPSGAVMMPTMWAAACAGCRADADLGVHITLNSEFPRHRWRPLTPGASLRDEFGYAWPTLDAAWANVRADEAEAEMRAQIDAALAIGIDATHIDTHMGAVFRPDLAAVYLRVALAYRVPAFVPNTASVPGLWIPDAWKPELEQVFAAGPLPRLGMIDGYGQPPAARTAWTLATVADLAPGVYHFMHHAMLPGDEAQAVPDAATRLADFAAFSDPAAQSALGGAALLTYRELRDRLRAAGIL